MVLISLFFTLTNEAAKVGNSFCLSKLLFRQVNVLCFKLAHLNFYNLKLEAGLLWFY